MSADRVRILVFRPGGAAPEVTTIEDTLAAMQAVVGGTLGGSRILPTVYVHYDDDGRPRGKPACIFVKPLGDVVVGTCFAIGVNDEGGSRSLSDEEIAEVRSMVTLVAFMAPGRFEA